jgi:hypothetical protein
MAAAMFWFHLFDFCFNWFMVNVMRRNPSAQSHRSPLFSRWSLTSLVILLLPLVARSGPAPILLTIDDSNPSAVIITATGSDPSVNYSGGNTANTGIDLLQFFTLDEGNMTFGEFLIGGLTGGNIGVNYNDVYSDNQSTGGGAFLDMELYVDVNSPGQGNPETFSTSQPAFSGTWTIDMSALGVTSAALPAIGTSGTINSGISGSTGANIGEWEVQDVPEPTEASLALLGFALTGFAALRRGRPFGRSQRHFLLSRRNETA